MHLLIEARPVVIALLFLASCGGNTSPVDRGPPIDKATAEGAPDRRMIDGPPSREQGARERGVKEGGAPDGPTPVTKITIAVASDIAEKGRTAHARATAAIISGHSPAVSAVLLGGDNARWSGVLSLTSLLSYYNTYYKPATEANWGQFDAIAFPQTGNHEYSFAIGESGAQGYFDYFKARMTAIRGLSSYHGFVEVVGKGYYSFDLNGWHIVSVNNNIDVAAGGAQEAWVKADLAAHATMPIIGVWHAPRYACGGSHGDATEMQPIWADFYDVGADFIFNGHDHFYQRWKPLDKATPKAAVDTTKGLTEIVVGSYGVATYAVCSPADSRVEKQIGDDGGIGAFFLTLGSDGSYSFEYRLESLPSTAFDSGAGVSHHHP
jgi:acid phosphatase type 7